LIAQPADIKERIIRKRHNLFMMDILGSLLSIYFNR
jgi:hypothetical protein